MTARMVRKAAALCAAAVLVSGCGGGGGGGTDALLAGRWSGALTMALAGGSGLSGGIVMQLSQTDAFVSGSADWAGVGETQSVSGPVDGSDFTLHMTFRCTELTDAGPQLRTLTAVLEGRADGETMTVTSASGRACAPRGLPAAVDAASGTLTRTRDNLPL